MKKKILVCVIALAVFSLLAVACTRSATGSPSDSAKSETALPNPVSTQSQLMKDIIAGTQTAMAVPLDATAADASDKIPDDGEDKPATEKTPAPAAKPTSVPLPTSTAGPPPVVELKYNTTKCGPGYYVCIQSYTKDKSVVLQTTYPWLLDGMDITFKMGPDGVYDYSEYIVVGTAKYSPEGAGAGFEVTLNIPDAMRGTNTIVVLLETSSSEYYGTDYFVNE
jgi:hypothetical protein